jgi:hypothetical protein
MTILHSFWNEDSDERAVNYASVSADCRRCRNCRDFRNWWPLPHLMLVSAKILIPE